MKNLKIIFIAFSENSLGRRIIQGMLEEGFKPELTLMASDFALNQFRKKGVRRYFKSNGLINTIWRIYYRLTVRKDVREYSIETAKSIEQSIAQTCELNNIKLVKFDDINSQEIISLINSITPDIIVLGGAPILKSKILEIPKIGVLNAHPGILPFAKGMDVVSQSIIDQLPLGTTVFKVDKGIDSGDILLKEYLNIEIKGKKLYEIETKIEELCATTMIKGIRLISENNYSFIPQEKKGKVYRALTLKKYLSVKKILNRI